MVTKRTRKRPPQRRYTLALDGDLAEFRVVMASISGRDIIRVRGGTLNEEGSLELFASHVIEHDFDVEDILELDYQVLLQLLSAWMGAIQDTALPPVTGGS